MAPRALSLVWGIDRRIVGVMAVGGAVGALVPAASAWVGKLIVDAVLAATADPTLRGVALGWVAVEAALVIGSGAVQRGVSVAHNLLRAKLGFRVNEMILERAVALPLPRFEDAAFYDKMTRARREASHRPLSLVSRLFSLGANLLTLLSLAGLLFTFSPLAVLGLIVATVPGFLAEARFSEQAFRLFSWRTPETRQQNYLESVLAREDHAKEVKLFGLGPMLLERYRSIFHTLYAEDAALTRRRSLWAGAFELFGSAAFYIAYAVIAVAAVAGSITLGEMTMYLAVFQQGQRTLASVLQAVGGMYEDNLYLSNLFEFLDEAEPERLDGALVGPDPADGVRFASVWFTYPGATEPALCGVDLHLRPGESVALVGENGSGKTTIVKLLAGLYAPDRGVVSVDGLDVQAWDKAALRRRIGVIFQDFVRYQFRVGENIGVGDVAHLDDAERQAVAAHKGLADEVIAGLPAGYGTQLGKWFKDGRELSGGQWQKLALSRAFMRDDADILVLDEPTAAVDAEAEHRIFERFRALAAGRTTVVISHRFSTVRMADRIVVLHRGSVEETGSHDALVAAGGRYARLFALQAAGYR